MIIRSPNGCFLKEYQCKEYMNKGIHIKFIKHYKSDLYMQHDVKLMSQYLLFVRHSNLCLQIQPQSLSSNSTYCFRKLR
jgi:hypothetical protein